MCNEKIVSMRHVDKAAQVEDIIRKDFAVWHTVSGLADMVKMTEPELQTVFKAVHGKTVAVFTREARLQHAYDQLRKTDAPLRVICEMVGYPDPSNFSYAFLQFFGYRPGAVRQHAGLDSNHTL